MELYEDVDNMKSAILKSYCQKQSKVLKITEKRNTNEPSDGDKKTRKIRMIQKVHRSIVIAQEGGWSNY